MKFWNMLLGAGIAITMAIPVFADAAAPAPTNAVTPESVTSHVTPNAEQLPTLWLIGDSTVKVGAAGQVGWGDPFISLFDPAKVRVENKARAGRSSRTFITEGLWEAVLTQMKSGDYLLMQFGHNDSVPLEDVARPRGTLPGVGDETREIESPKTHRKEVVHTYGWYMKKMVSEAKAKGARVVVLSPVPRENWKEGKVLRIADTYGHWAQEVTDSQGVLFLDLNEIIASRWEAMGPEKVKLFFPQDHTHTNLEGARFNAFAVVAGLKTLPGQPFDALLLAPNR